MDLCLHLGLHNLKYTVMARSKEISLEKRQSVVVLQSEGYSMREIAWKVKISLHGVHTCLARKARTGSNVDRKRCGRPKITSKAEDNHIRVCSLRNRYLTCPERTSELNNTRKQAGAKAVSSSTVHCHLKASGLMGRVARKKQLLKRKNKVKRYAWVKKHRNWTREQWKRVLWSDESKFEVFGSKRRAYIQKRTRERMKAQCIEHTVKHGGGSVMVWGCFGAGKVGNLYRVEEILNQHGYHNILRHAIPSGQCLVGANFVMQLV